MSAATARINMRVTEEAREVIDRAAEAQGIDRTAFMVDAAVTRARSVLLEEAILKLSAGEVAQIADLMENPPAPNDELNRAARRLAELRL
ncbi:type II toxin-antitoxin system TacA family antitoxin [Leucobacter sp. HY1910]